MSELIYRAKLRGVREFKRFTRRPLRGLLNPFESKDSRPLVVHRCYHKVGTVWFGRVLRDIAAEFGMSYSSSFRAASLRDYQKGRARSDVFLDLGSHVDLQALPSYRGSHMIRDPRDLVVSAYFYHKWTSEPWANEPKPEYGGLSYKERLNSLSKEHGILLEMEKSGYWITHMAEWSFDDPHVFEIRYEDMLAHEDEIFEKLFQHYGFTPGAIDKCCSIAAKYSFGEFKRKQRLGSPSHLRSGKPQEWREHFNDRHIAKFKSLYPNVLTKLGYETGETW